MKILTKTHLLELLKTKQAVAFLRDGQTFEISRSAALSWADALIESNTTGYMWETKSFVWIAADKDQHGGENLWTITQAPQ